MKIRVAVDTDKGACEEIRGQIENAAPDTVYWRAGDNEPLVADWIERRWLFVAEDEDGHVVGMLGAIPAGPDGWYVGLFGVLDGYRGRGVGKALMESVAIVETAKGRTRAYATPIPTAIATYEKIGFKPVATCLEWVYA